MREKAEAGSGCLDALIRELDRLSFRSAPPPDEELPLSRRVPDWLKKGLAGEYEIIPMNEAARKQDRK